MALTKLQKAELRLELAPHRDLIKSLLALGYGRAQIFELLQAQGYLKRVAYADFMNYVKTSL